MMKLLEIIYHLGIEISFFLIGLLPPKNIIVFESFHGKQCSDSPKAIYDYIQKENLQIECIWSVKKGYTYLFEDEKIPFITRLGVKWLFIMPRAKFWVVNTRLPKWMKKNKKTTYIQTWHGTPLKKLGLDIETIRMPENKTVQYKSEFTKESSRWDILISPNKYSTSIFRNAFGYNGQVLEIGYPRNDSLKSDNVENIKQQTKDKLSIQTYNKVILYAPTWRDDEFYKKGSYQYNNHFPFLDILNIDESIIILTRLHYLISDALDISKYSGRVRDVSRYPDISQLYLISDLLITDYSSVMFDFGLTKKPMIFFMYDKEKYEKKTRGFYFDPDEVLPGPIVTDTVSLVDAVEKELNSQEINPKYDQFYSRFCFQNANSSELIVKKMIGE